MHLPIKKCIFKTPGGRRLVVKNSLKGRIRCYCKDVQNICGIVIDRVNSNDEGKWSCRMNFVDKRGHRKKQKKSINLVLEEEYDDDEEYYEDDQYYYDEHPYQPTQTPSICSNSDPEWKTFRDHCYYVVKDHKTMQSCREECNSRQGQLASIHSRDENNFIADLIRQRPARVNQLGQVAKSICNFIFETSCLSEGNFYWWSNEPKHWRIFMDGRDSMGLYILGARLPGQC